MSLRWLARTTAVVGLAGSGVYFFIYLYRWAWNRALLAGLVFIAAELGLSLMVIMERLRGIDSRIDHLADEGDGRRYPGRRYPDPAVLEHLQATAPDARKPFRWLTDGDTGTAVFVPILLGAGVVASALAWLVERIAARTARPALERALAGRLASIAWPDTDLGARTGPPRGWLAGPRPDVGP